MADTIRPTVKNENKVLAVNTNNCNYGGTLMKKLSLLLLLLLSGTASAVQVSGFTLIKECGADVAVCETYASELFSFNVFLDNTASDPSGSSDVSYGGSLGFGDLATFSGFRQDTVWTITETLPSIAWANVQWEVICTATSDCFSSYNDSVPNQISFNLTIPANADTLTIKAVNTLVPIPAAVWLFGSGLIGLVGMARRKKAA